MHVLDENVRQQDLDERAALAELRAGDVERAVEWYRDNDRIVAVPSRDEAMDQLVDGWATDLLAGRDAAMFAWRRANVAELNRRGRQRWAEAGRLTGPEMEAPGGRRFAAGDRIVTLAPGAGGQLVTSERGSVIEVDQAGCGLVARMDDGRVQQFGSEDTTADQLDHGYAVTVHRSQGATVDVAQVLEDGGGRELAYVAMSRARQRSMAYVVADDVDQVAEDLERNWTRERRQGWAIDTGTPAAGADALKHQADEAHELPGSATRSTQGTAWRHHRRAPTRTKEGAGQHRSLPQPAGSPAPRPRGWSWCLRRHSRGPGCPGAA